MDWIEDRKHGCRLQLYERRGLRHLVLENRALRVTVLPDKGADIVELRLKALDLDVLWTSPTGLRDPRITIPSSDGAGAMMDLYEGGWQEIVPSGGPSSTHLGATWGQHGESTTLPWEIQVVEDAPDHLAVTLRVRLLRYPLTLCKTLHLRGDQAVLEIEECLTNDADEPVEVMWGHHPAVGAPFLSASCRFYLPGGEVRVPPVPGFASQRAAPGARGPWPIIPDREGGTLDMSCMPAPEARTAEMLYITDMPEGWYAILNESLGAGFGLVWDTAVFPHLWYWQVSRGGFGYPWYGRTYSMALEPWSSWPGNGPNRSGSAGHRAASCGRRKPIYHSVCSALARARTCHAPLSYRRGVHMSGSVEATSGTASMVQAGPAALAIDLGGTRIKAGIVVGQEVVVQRIVPTEDELGFDHVLQQLIAVGEQLLQLHPAAAIGLSLPAVVDVGRGTVVDVRKNLSGLIDFPLVEVLQQHFTLPVAVENDARLYGLGEMIAGAGRGYNNLVCLTLGTGIGCCVVYDGHILRGTHGTGSVLGGHMTIETYGPPCTCGNIGCVEALCSAPALVASLAARMQRAAVPAEQGSVPLTAEAVLAAAARGDALAADALAEYIRHLSAAVVSYIHVYDPDLVVLGGGVMHAAAQILPALQQFVWDHTWTSPPRRIPVRAALLSDSAALVGAAALARGEARFW